MGGRCWSIYPLEVGRWRMCSTCGGVSSRQLKVRMCGVAWTRPIMPHRQAVQTIDIGLDPTNHRST